MNPQSRFAFSPEIIVDLFADANVGELLAMEKMRRLWQLLLTGTPVDAFTKFPACRQSAPNSSPARR